MPIHSSPWEPHRVPGKPSNERHPVSKNTAHLLFFVLIILVAVSIASLDAFGVPLPNPIRGYHPLADIFAAIFG